MISCYDFMKNKICLALALAFPDLQFCFEIETNASKYAMGAIFLQGFRFVCYHSKVYTSAIRGYLVFGMELMH